MRLETETCQAFCRRLYNKYGVSIGSLKQHFFGIRRKGIFKKPHVILETQAAIVEQKEYISDKVQVALREDIETKGLKIVNKKFDQLLKRIDAGEFDGMSPKDIAGILKTVTGSQDSRRSLDLKKVELDSKTKHYDRMFNKALYGEPIDGNVIQDADIEEPALLSDGQGD